MVRPSAPRPAPRDALNDDGPIGGGGGAVVEFDDDDGDAERTGTGGRRAKAERERKKKLKAGAFGERRRERVAVHAGFILSCTRILFPLVHVPPPLKCIR